jgi:dihydrolipoamide dehydrogenase
MVMGELPENVDIAIVGGGVGGYVAAIRAAELGKSVALVEKEKLGGHCLNYACIPSKTLIHISDIFYAAKNSERFGIHADNVTLDAKKMYEWRMAVSKKLEEGVAYLCKMNQIDVFNGTATFMSASRLQLSNGVELDFKNAIIATGSVPTPMQGFEIDGKSVLDYKQALMLDYVPKSMAIIGAGYVSVEIGMLYAKLGANVSIVARSDVLSRFDREAVAVIKKKMAELGIKVYAGVTPASRDGTAVKLSDGTTLSSDIIVVAVGLVPYTDGLGLENTKVERDQKGFVKVDNSLRTAENGIFAIGDVVGEPMLAHKAMRQGVVAAEIAAGMQVSYDNKVVPAVIFSDPEIAIAGSIEEGEGIAVKKFPLTALGRAIAFGETSGFVKIAYDNSGLVKGVEIVSPDANAMIAEAALAIEMGATVDDMAETIHPHPTFSEAVQEAAEAAAGKPTHFFYGR